MALRCSSVKSSSSSTCPEPPIIRSVMIRTSCSLRINTLLPSIPSLYEICIITQGLSYFVDKSSQVATLTDGVVIFTFWLSNELKVVAAVPILILDISPTASFSNSSNSKPVLSPSDDVISESSPPVSTPLSNAFISSCDNMPSITNHSPL